MAGNLQGEADLNFLKWRTRKLSYLLVILNSETLGFWGTPMTKQPYQEMLIIQAVPKLSKPSSSFVLFGD
jgi:hypothetical protein